MGWLIADIMVKYMIHVQSHAMIWDGLISSWWTVCTLGCSPGLRVFILLLCVSSVVKSGLRTVSAEAAGWTVQSVTVCCGGGRGHRAGRCGQSGRPTTRALHQHPRSVLHPPPPHFWTSSSLLLLYIYLISACRLFDQPCWADVGVHW